MQRFNQALLLGVIALALTLSRGTLPAQPPPNMGGMDPQQMQQFIQQRVMEFIREQLSVTNDSEWTVIQERLSKVTQGRMQSLLGGMGGFRGLMGRNRGNDGPPGGGRGFMGLAQPDPEADALQRALDAKAPKDQLKAALEKYREARKRRQVELAAAQEQLRQVLSFRQEAVLVSLGMLD